MPITDKLNAIITKLSDGATKPTGQTIEEKLDIIDSLIDAGGGSSGGGALMVEIAPTEAGGSTYQMDKTAGEIIAAIQEGKNVICHFPDDYYLYQYGMITSTWADTDNEGEITTISIDAYFGSSHGSLQFVTNYSLDGYPQYSYE